MAKKKAEVEEVVKDEAYYNKVAAPIVVDGFKHGAEEDAIKGAMFTAGVPFGMIAKIYRAIAIENGLIVDPAVLKAALDKDIGGSDWTAVETYEQFLSICQDIADENQGATVAKVINMATKYCKDEGIELPKKAKVTANRARGGKTLVAINELLLKNPQATKQDAAEAVLPHVKAWKNATDYVQAYFLLAFACTNDMTMADAFEATKNQKMINPEIEVEDEVEDEDDDQDSSDLD